MLSFKKYILKIKTTFPFEVAQNYLVMIIVMLIILTASYALYRPVNQDQFEQVVVLKNQYTLPETQDMAEKLASQSTISNAEYYRLINAYSFESSNIKKYPDLNIHDLR